MTNYAAYTTENGPSLADMLAAVQLMKDKMGAILRDQPQAIQSPFVPRYPCAAGFVVDTTINPFLIEQ